jgi:hypothetical protein
MKKAIYLILILIGFVFSCSKDYDFLNIDLQNTSNSSLKATGTLPYSVSLVAISFDYDHANNTEDGIDIRQNWDVDILGDYNPASGKKDPFAYKMGRTNVKVKVFISATNADLSTNDVLNIEGRLISGGEIGNFRGTITLNTRGSSISYGNGILTADGSVASSVGINNNLKWEWHVTARNNSACDYTIATSGPHTLYRLFDVPMAPWYFSNNTFYGDPQVSSGNWLPTTDKRGKEPHIDFILQNACEWAQGLSSAKEIVTKITNSTFSLFETKGITYTPNPDQADPYQTVALLFAPNSNPIFFHIINVKYFSPNNSLVRNVANCSFAADYVHILTRALGIDTKIIQFDKNEINFSTTPCQPFKLDENHIQSFEFHQVVLYNNEVFDPTAKFHNNGDKLITGVSRETYLILAVSQTDRDFIVWSPEAKIDGITWKR